MKSLIRTLALLQRGIGNYIRKKPYCVSFEVTYHCNARCKHCHLGGLIEEHRAMPEIYGERCNQLRPVVAQVSGGEPLLRNDLERIIEALRTPNRAPYIVVTTNGALLTKERFRSLCKSGVDSYSLSLDYPDERHNEFRRVPRLFQRIQKLIKELEPEERNIITISCVVQRDNFRDLIAIAKLAKEWGVNINYSTYTWLRTKDKGYMLTKKDLAEFKLIVARLLDFRKRYKNLFATEYVFGRMIRFFENGFIPDCRAGQTFLIVNPDGTLSPCGLINKKYDTQEEIIQDFSRMNVCGDCNTSIRANSEKPARYLMRDNLWTLLK